MAKYAHIYVYREPDAETYRIDIRYPPGMSKADLAIKDRNLSTSVVELALIMQKRRMESQGVPYFVHEVGERPREPRGIPKSVFSGKSEAHCPDCFACGGEASREHGRHAVCYYHRTGEYPLFTKDRGETRPPKDTHVNGHRRRA